jgi:hypothetical protein
MNPEIERAQSHPSASLPLVFAFLIGPVAFLLDLSVSYAMLPKLCQSGARVPLYVPTLVALSMLAVGWVLARRRGRDPGEVPADRRVERNQFLTQGAYSLLGFFVFLLAGLLLAKVVFSPCDF